MDKSEQLAANDQLRRAKWHQQPLPKGHLGEENTDFKSSLPYADI